MLIQPKCNHFNQNLGNIRHMDYSLVIVRIDGKRFWRGWMNGKINSCMEQRLYLRLSRLKWRFFCSLLLKRIMLLFCHILLSLWQCWNSFGRSIQLLNKHAVPKRCVRLKSIRISWNSLKNKRSISANPWSKNVFSRFLWELGGRFKYDFNTIWRTQSCATTNIVYAKSSKKKMFVQ